jgi:hypothetical protein
LITWLSLAVAVAVLELVAVAVAVAIVAQYLENRQVAVLVQSPIFHYNQIQITA